MTDPAEYCKMTESWLSEKDLGNPVSQIDPGAVEEPHEDEGPPVVLDEPDDFGDGAALTPPGDDADDDYLDPGQNGEGDVVAIELTPGDAASAAAQPATGPAQDNQPADTTPPRFNKRIAVGFVGASVAASVIAVGALLAMRSEPHTAPTDHLAPAPGRTGAPVVAPTTTTATAQGTDPPVAYTATAVGCLPGSTAAQSVAGANPTQAWVCVTGGNIGQYVRLNLGRAIVITAVCVAPGWVGADTSGADQWHQHRVLTRVQWSFNDNPPTVVPQETNSVHGDACQPMPNHGVLASTVLMLVQETGRAPADTAPSTPPPALDGGPVGQILGTPAEPAPSDPAAPPDQSHTDVADNSFASSSITLFGHPPQ